MVDSQTVVVVGAGLAGLIAARELSRAGVEVTVLEARERVGGRTWTVEFQSAGRSVDLGAEWVAPEHHTAVVAEVDSYGLSLELDQHGGGDGGGMQFDDADRADVERALQTFEEDASLIDIENPQWFHPVLHLDVTMEEYLLGLGLTPRAREAILASAFALMGADEADYSVLNLLHEVAAFGGAKEALSGESARVGGGSGSIAQVIHEELQSRVRCSHMVRSIRPTEDGVRVAGDEFAIDATVAIVAVPVNVLDAIHIEPPLDQTAAKVIAEGHAGRAAKGWATATGTTDRVYSTGWPDAIEVYTLPGGKADAIARFGVAKPTHEASMQRAWTALQRRHHVVGEAQAELSHDWIGDEFARGSWFCAKPGQQQGWHALAAMSGPLFFAGGDLSRRWFGWMDGAITSGSDAALRAIAYLDGQPIPPARG